MALFGFETVGNFFSLSETPGTTETQLGLNGLLDVSVPTPTNSLAEQIETATSSLLDISLPKLSTNSYSPVSDPAIASAKDTTEGMNNLNSLIAAGMSKAEAQQKVGNLMKTVAATEQLFNTVLNWDSTKKLNKLEYENTVQQAQNKMTAIDNQVAYVKAQMTDKMNKIIAQNTVNAAARNIKVTAGSILEESKGVAQEMNESTQMLESNAKIEKIGLESQKKQAKIKKDLADKQQYIQLFSGLTQLGMSAAQQYGGVEELAALI